MNEKIQPEALASRARAARPGSEAPGTVAPGTSGKYGWVPLTLHSGDVIHADSSGGSTGPQLLYQAMGAGNLRA